MSLTHKRISIQVYKKVKGDGKNNKAAPLAFCKLPVQFTKQ